MTMGIVGNANASQAIVINDASTIKYGIQDNKVWLRNLSDFDSSWLPCCYNYYFDLSTDGGKAMFSTFLSYALSGKKVVFYKADPSTAGAITIFGDF
jgi:hypothetical protein